MFRIVMTSFASKVYSWAVQTHAELCILYGKEVSGSAVTSTGRTQNIHTLNIYPSKPENCLGFRRYGTHNITYGLGFRCPCLFGVSCQYVPCCPPPP